MRLPPMITALGLMLASASTALAAPCGGDFASFLGAIKKEAQARGFSATEADRFLASARHDPRVIKADRAQGFFSRPFSDFSKRLISQARLKNGQANAQKYKSVFDRAARDYGIPPGILLAFWAFETDYGAVQGDFNTVNALLTLGHDCRRPELFQPQIHAAMQLWKRGMLDPATTTGAWAGEIGMVQMLPGDILERGVDGDGDGKIDLKRSAPDALMSGARMLRELGWRPNEPWLQEVVVPKNLDWSKSGLDKQLSIQDWTTLGVKPRQGQLAQGLKASLLLPEGRNGPAFLAYPNFNTLFEWNKSFVYVTTAAYFATLLQGAPAFNPGNPDPQLSEAEMKSLQQKLQKRGYDVGKIDGILGAMTRVAVQKEQARLGLPADAWPTRTLLEKL